MASLKPYPTYTDSGVPWLMNVPDHWSMVRARHLFRKMDRPILDKDEVVTCFRDGVVTLRKNRRLRGFTESLKEIGYQGIHQGDLVIHAMDAFAGAVGVSDSAGKGTPVYSVCEPASNVNAYYYAYLIREMARSQWILALSKGIRERSTDFRFETFTSQLVPLPPLPEQQSIVRFLDHTDRLIRRYIHTRRQLIQLLTEQKQALIHRAVTRGLDPSVPLKPSGVEWIGDIPEHWEIQSAKSYYKEVDDRSLTGEEELLSVSHITGVTPRSQKNITMFMASSYLGHKLCKPGDLVINTMWAWMGAMGVSKQIGIVSPSYGVYRPIRAENFLEEYLDLLLRTQPYINEYICRSTGIRSSRLRLYPEQFLRMKIIFPPIVEQRVILERIKTETSAIDNAISNTQKEIFLLQEYRTRLIADVVTGKLDVRAAAARLPAEILDQETPEADEPVEDETLAEAELDEAQAEV